MKKYFITLLILFVLYNSGESLKCWYCTPTARPNCDDVFVESNVKEEECYYNNSYPVCRTMINLFSNGEVRVIIRDCNRKITYSNNFVAQHTNTTEETYVVETITSYCDTDFCNSAKIIYSYYTIPFVAIISFLCTLKSLY